MTISIVIPTLNEEEYLRRTIENLLERARNAHELELLVIDAGSDDNTLASISDLDVSVFSKPSFQLRKSESLNFGLKQAKGEVVIFLDADTLLPKDFDQLIVSELANEQVVGGAFEMRFENVGGKLFILSKLNQLRYRVWKTFYGDQAIFCKKAVAVKSGGFKDTLMEAAFFSRSISKHGKLSIIDRPVITSPRRFDDGGFWIVLWFDIRMWVRFMFGLPLQKHTSTYWEKNIKNG